MIIAPCAEAFRRTFFDGTHTRLDDPALCLAAEPPPGSSSPSCFKYSREIPLDKLFPESQARPPPRPRLCNSHSEPSKEAPEILLSLPRSSSVTSTRRPPLTVGHQNDGRESRGCFPKGSLLLMDPLVRARLPLLPPTSCPQNKDKAVALLVIA